MMTWILPMAGRGTRVQELGECKPAINVAGRSILEWCLTGLSNRLNPSDRIIAVTTDFFEERYQLSELGSKWCSKLGIGVTFEIITVPETPPGPAASVLVATDALEENRPVVVVNVDQYCVFDVPSFGQDWDAFMPLYVNTTGKSSYAEIRTGLVKRVVEKELISSYASAGIYGFRSGLMLSDLLKDELSRDPHHHGEYYVGPTLNNLIEKGRKIIPSSVSVKCDLGNVNDIKSFEKLINSIC